jgi:hypothetical protein
MILKDNHRAKVKQNNYKDIALLLSLMLTLLNSYAQQKK